MHDSTVYRICSVLFLQCDRLVEFKAVISHSECDCLWTILCKNRCSDPSKHPTLKSPILSTGKKDRNSSASAEELRPLLTSNTERRPRK